MSIERDLREKLRAGHSAAKEGRLDESVGIFDRLRDTCARQKDLLGEALCELEAANAEFLHRNAEAYKRADRRLQALHDKHGESWPAGDDGIRLRARVHHLQGVIALRRWDPATAQRHLDRALEAIDGRNETAILSWILDTYGQLHEFLGRTQQAISDYVTSMALKCGINDRSGISISLNNLGRLQCKLEEWPAARRVLEGRVTLSEELEDREGLVASGGLLALATARCGAADRALELVERPLELTRARKLDHQMAFVLKCKAEILLLHSKPFEAESAAVEAYRILTHLEDPVAAAHLQRVQGEALAAQGMHSEAHEALRSASQRLREGEDLAEEISALDALALVYKELGRRSDALAAIDRAIALARKAGYQNRLLRLNRQHEQILAMSGSVVMQLEPLRVRWAPDEETPLVREELALPSLDLEIVRRLGEGGMGIVYQVKDRAGGEVYALKQLLEPRGHSASLRERFQNEALSAASFSHPNIIKIHSVVQDDGSNLYLLMAYVPGGSLIGQRLTWRRAFGLGARIAGALSRVHSAGIVHRDLKPGNILLSSTGEPILTDFGIAHLPSAEMTFPGELIGTLNYLPPEALLGSLPHPSWDVFALGVTLYELIEGTRPYQVEEPSSRLPYIPTIHPRTPREEDLPPHARDLLLRLVAYSPEQRPSAASLVTLLSDALQPRS